ncbi:hypothetical protein ABC347_04930 [Sphingomonas sp. 1P06PA]|uniref:ImuA family protein n=1 Tax=Sphingomonas sp. 1P06PA TaxID=554121 RepID=UPI0039A6106A
MRSDRVEIAALKQRIARIAAVPAPDPLARVTLGNAGIDMAIGGGLARAALHEVMAASQADIAAATGFTAGLAARALGGRPLLWVRQTFVDAEAGWLHGSGLAELGIDPALLLLVCARDALAVLRAGNDAVRSGALGAVVIEPWGMPPRLDLTASRRLALAAESSGVMTLLLRVAAEPKPGAAATRWLVAASPSRPREANAPGSPAFAVTLDRSKTGGAGRTWVLEWDRDRGCFDERGSAPLSGTVVPSPADRSFAWRRAG